MSHSEGKETGELLQVPLGQSESLPFVQPDHGQL